MVSSLWFLVPVRIRPIRPIGPINLVLSVLSWTEDASTLFLQPGALSGRVDGLPVDVPDGGAFGMRIQWTGSGPAFVVGWVWFETDRGV